MIIVTAGIESLRSRNSSTADTVLFQGFQIAHPATGKIMDHLSPEWWYKLEVQLEWSQSSGGLLKNWVIWKGMFNWNQICFAMVQSQRKVSYQHCHHCKPHHCIQCCFIKAHPPYFQNPRWNEEVTKQHIWCSKAPSDQKQRSQIMWLGSEMHRNLCFIIVFECALTALDT